MKKSEISIGIVCPVHNCLKYTKETFESLETKYPHQWIFIDNASTDGTKEWILSLMETHDNILYWEQEKNQSVAASWNMGIQKTFELGHSAAFVINNDLVFAPDTVDNLISWFGPEEIDDCYEFVTVTSVGNRKDLLESAERRESVIGVPQFIGFLIGPRVIKRVGLFDEGFKRAYFEDNDYHFRMMQEKVLGVAANNAFVAHYGSRTIKEGGVDHVQDFIENRIRFKQRWGVLPEEVSSPPRRNIERKVKPRLLWVGDGVVPTGFATVTHNILNALTGAWDVSLLAINYRGDPHDYPYPIYSARAEGDMKGLNRVQGILQKVQPHLICIINDPWVVDEYLKTIHRLGCTVPVIAYIPVDGKNQYFASALNNLTMAIFYTQFGAEEFKAAGFKAPYTVIPHGVNHSYYKSLPQEEARKKMGWENYEGLMDAYIVGNVNRNQPRKRNDLTVQYFAEWVERYDLPENVKLYMHCANEDVGYKIPQLAKYFGVDDRLIMPGDQLSVWHGMRVQDMHLMYNSLDVQVSTTIGEGFGLTHLEGMLCGIPQIVPDWAALGEWGKDVMRLVPCSAIEVNPGGINTVGGVPDKEKFIEELQLLYSDAKIREEYGKKALGLASEDRFDWTTVASQFAQLFAHVVSGQAKSKEQLELELAYDGN